MNVLKKILEEILQYTVDVYECDLDDIVEYQRKNKDNKCTYIVQGIEEATEFIRSHMDDIPNCGECSRREWYQKGFEDGKKDSDWIPVEERLPNQNGVYNVTRLVDDAFISDSAYFDGQDTWHSDDRVNHTRPYLTDIVAWQPLPEPYIKNPK